MTGHDGKLPYPLRGGAGGGGSDAGFGFENPGTTRTPTLIPSPQGGGMLRLRLPEIRS